MRKVSMNDLAFLFLKSEGFALQLFNEEGTKGLSPIKVALEKRS